MHAFVYFIAHFFIPQTDRPAGEVRGGGGVSSPATGPAPEPAAAVGGGQQSTAGDARPAETIADASDRHRGEISGVGEDGRGDHVGEGFRRGEWVG